ncbi:iron-sulfur cluster assembly scaffold protein [Candidatus Woesearchaeota archaeon]|nr:iron-sulfur cluster assembly scaffold protein [Candidatus Woesearchaeota archaeon]
MSYVTESATVHNCGDLMWIYIKVKKNEKGEEILEDVHFKTFGCVAAIATSSMITDLAKGKTLDDALKITKRDVSAALGSLPPIKEHCSNLAAEGLHKAIENYRKKVPVNTEKGFKKCEKSCCPGGKK